MNEILAQALRMKLRFNINGEINLERLFQYSYKHVEALDAYYQQIQSQYTNVDSLLGKTGMTIEDSLRCEILKYLVTSLINQENERKTISDKRKQRDDIMRIIESKQEDALSNKSLSELQTMLDAL